MEIVLQEHPDRMSVRVVGDASASRSGDIEDRILPLIGAGRPPIDVDLSEMNFLSSTGLAVFVRLMRSARQAKQTMRLLRPTPHIERMMRLASLPLEA